MSNVYIGNTTIEHEITANRSIFCSATITNKNEITSVTIPSNVTAIAQRAFRGTNITSITIPNTVTRIYKYAFKYTDLTTVTIPASVKKIGDEAFANCSFLKKVYFEGDPPDLSINIFFDGKPFKNVSDVTFYYKAGNTNWANKVGNSTYGGSTNATWATY